MDEETRERIVTEMFTSFGDPTKPGFQRSDFRKAIDRALSPGPGWTIQRIPFRHGSPKHPISDPRPSL